LVSLAVVLEERPRNDWFASSFIVTFAILSAVSLLAMVTWEAQTLLQQRAQIHHARLVEHIMPSAPSYQDTLSGVTEFFIARGSDSASAAHQALMWMGQTIDRQATLLSFIDVS
jgi:hypothetical protein